MHPNERHYYPVRKTPTCNTNVLRVRFGLVISNRAVLFFGLLFSPLHRRHRSYADSSHCGDLPKDEVTFGGKQLQGQKPPARPHGIEFEPI